MHRPSLPFLIALFLILSLTAVPAAQTSWQQVIDRKAGFCISFPGRPTYQTSVDPATGMQIEIYKFFYTGHLLRITFAPLPPARLSPAELSKVHSEFAQQVVLAGGTLLRQQKLPDGGRQYDTVANTGDGTIYGRTRFYIRNSGYYVIAFEMYARDGIDELQAERFLSSFRFLDIPPRRKTPKRANLSGKSSSKGSATDSWYTLRSPDNDFTVVFPGKPSYQLDSSTGDIPSHRYHYFYGENIFQVSYRESPEANTQPEEALRRAVEIYTSPSEGRRVLRMARLSDGGYKIESQGITDGTPFYSRTQIYVRGARLYYVTALIQNLSGPNEADVARFFESFRFV